MQSPTGKAAVHAQAAKQAVRERVWQLLERSGAALPPGAYGRIPMFEGADAAADRLAGLPEWRQLAAARGWPSARTGRPGAGWCRRLSRSRSQDATQLFTANQIDCLFTYVIRE